MSASDHLQPAQFFHGSPRKFAPGDVIESGHASHSGVPAEHVFLSTTRRNAKLWGSTPDADGTLRGGHVYEVTAPASYEPDEAGNSATGTKANYRTREPVTVVRKVKA